MKLVRLHNKPHRYEIEIPETWDEAAGMLTDALDDFYKQRGKNPGRAGVAARVAYAMFGEQFQSADPTTAIVQLMLEICKREGAGLDGED